jgi:DNA-binding transcriptional MerR regulator
MRITEDKIPDLLELVARENRTSVGRMKSKDRTRFVLEARIMCYKILRDNGYKLAEIGKIFNKHHAAVLHSLKLHERNYLTFNYYQETYDSIMYILGLNDSDSNTDSLILNQYREKVNTLHEKIANLKGENIALKRQLETIKKTSKFLTQNLKSLCS